MNCELCNEILQVYPNDLRVRCESGCLRDVSAFKCNHCDNIRAIVKPTDVFDCIDCVMMDKPAGNG
jgi:hypothetical protein